MLVLSRKKGERIFIGDDIIVTVIRFNDGNCRLGFEAPKHIYIRREELPSRGTWQDVERQESPVGPGTEGTEQPPA